MVRFVLCPCCDKPARPRRTPITPGQAERFMEFMKERGWTEKRLLAERGADLDYIAPGMTEWLRQTS